MVVVVEDAMRLLPLMWLLRWVVVMGTLAMVDMSEE